MKDNQLKLCKVNYETIYIFFPAPNFLTPHAIKFSGIAAKKKKKKKNRNRILTLLSFFITARKIK
jgi:hypothetical protein